mmetsp:Transcript_24440/g.17188  ORF Transcript_24440/g.17188 Transcript_24440/m.17188 type:complete len:84 (-) Transcript_24440:85-336(-)
MDIVFWFRQLIGFLCGLVAGFVGLQGITVIFMFIIVSFFISYIHFSKVLNVNDDDLAASLYTEGLGNCIGIFMLVWTSTYNFI